MSIKYVTIIHDLCQDFNCFASDNEIIIAKIYNTAAKFRELMHPISITASALLLQKPDALINNKNGFGKNIESTGALCYNLTQYRAPRR